MPFEPVAGFDRADAGRRARIDQVSRLQSDESRQVRNRLGNIPDQLGEIAFLLDRAVDLEPDRAFGRVAAAGCRNKRGTRRRIVEGLAHFPRAAHFLGFALQVAARHVEADAVSPYVIERLVDRNVRSAFADGHDQFDLVMQVLGRLRIGNGRVIGHDRIRRLHEKKRRLAVGVVAHLARVLGVVATDAIDAPDREHVAAFHHRQRGRRADIDYVFHALPFWLEIGKKACVQAARPARGIGVADCPGNGCLRARAGAA